MLKRTRPLPLLVMFGLLISGCGQSNPAPVAKPANSTLLTPTPETGAAGTPGKPATATTEDPPVAKAKPLGDVKPKTAVSANAQTFPEAAFLGDDVVGLVVGHPKRITGWPVYQMMKEAGLLEEFERQAQGINIKPEDIERVTLVIDQTSINSTAKAAGLEAGGDEKPAPVLGQQQLKNNL